jgi:deoxyribodipyrimidine photo-lyase
VSASLHWFTTDLRLDDNPALAAADGPVAGVFVLIPRVLARHAGAPRRLAFLHATLQALDASLRACGSRLLVVEGEPDVALPPLAARLGARRVTHALNHEPAARAREAAVARALGRDGVAVHATEAGLVQPAGSVRTAAGGAYRVYSAFARTWATLPVPAAARRPPRFLPAASLHGIGRGLPAPDPAIALPPAGEDAARRRLADFLRRQVRDYPEARDVPARDATSRLSPYLRWGAPGAAEAVRRARAVAARDPARAAGVRVWVRELAWRDFFAHLLDAEPAILRTPLHPLRIRWRRDERALRRWREGTTGIPLVDAGMRELRATGFLHNRVRMIVASFLTRHLLLDWRLGEAHFMAELLDAQLAQNDGNWQWVAGTGADAQPFHRIFSPTRQGERFDPDGAYVRRWVPELARVPARAIHAPWTLAQGERRALCPDYPPPVVDLAAGRARALAAFEAARTSKGGGPSSRGTG